MLLKYKGDSHRRGLSASDLITLGLETHPYEDGLNFVKGEPIEVDDKVGELLATQLFREFEQVEVPSLAEELTRDELLAQARELKVPRAGGMNKEQLAEAIETAKQIAAESGS